MGAINTCEQHSWSQCSQWQVYQNSSIKITLPTNQSIQIYRQWKHTWPFDSLSVIQVPSKSYTSNQDIYNTQLVPEQSHHTKLYFTQNCTLLQSTVHTLLYVMINTQLVAWPSLTVHSSLYMLQLNLQNHKSQSHKIIYWYQKKENTYDIKHLTHTVRLCQS